MLGVSKKGKGSTLKSIFLSLSGDEEGAKLLMQRYGIPKKHVLHYKGLSVEQMKEKLFEMNQGELIPAVFDLVGGPMKELCFAVVDYSGHVASILPEKKGFPIELWARNESVSFAKSLSVHFIFVGAEAYSGPPKSWNIYRQQLSYIAKLIESGELQVFEPEAIGPLSKESVVTAHQKIERGQAKSKLVMTVN